MIALLRKLVSGQTELPEVKQLREALEKNRDERKKYLSWVEFFDHRNEELESMYARFAKNPKDLELGTQIIARHSQLAAEQTARGRLQEFAFAAVHPQCIERTRAALRPALEAIADNLRAKVAEAREHDKQHAAAFELEVGADSEITKKIDAACGEAERWLKRIDTATEHDIAAAVKFVLG